MKRMDVYKILDDERDYQISEGYDIAHDRGHTIAGLVYWMQYYLKRAEKFSKINEDKAALNNIRKATAIGIACGEVHGFLPRKPEEWVYEDQLPEMTDEEYSEWFNKSSVIDGVRMGPKYKPKEDGGIK